VLASLLRCEALQGECLKRAQSLGDGAADYVAKARVELSCYGQAVTFPASAVTPDIMDTAQRVLNYTPT